MFSRSLILYGTYGFDLGRVFFFFFLFLASEQDGECHKANSRICWVLPNYREANSNADGPPTLAASGAGGEGRG